MSRHEYALLDVFTDTKFAGNQLAVFDGQLDREQQRAMARVACDRQRALLPVAPRGFGRFRPDFAHLPAARLDLRGSGIQRIREQEVFGVRLGHARQRADFRVRESAVSERRGDRGQVAQSMRRPDFLARG